MLSTAFSWQPLSSFSLWVILLPSDSRVFFFAVRSIHFLSSLSSATLGFMQLLFLHNLCGQSWQEVRSSLHLAMVFACVFSLLLHGSKVRQQLDSGVFVRWNDFGFAFTCLVVKRLTNLGFNELSSLAVQEIVSQAVHEVELSS